jgi:tRNA A37 threonylcarbamoyladenosine synthetase subunit TsaC/SUA5/YrdC
VNLVASATPAEVTRVAEVILAGGVAAVPWGRQRRSTYVLLARSDDPASLARMNRIKGRSASQVVAVSGGPELLPIIADLGRLQRAADNAGWQGDVAFAIAELFRIGPIGLMLPAREGLNPAVLSSDDRGGQTVMLAGECPADEPDNFFHLLTRHLATEHQVLVAGTSGNRSKNPTYTARQYTAAETDLGPDLDVFVRPIPSFPAMRPWDSPVSCTILDFTDWPPKVSRHGSIHPSAFRPVVAPAPSIQPLQKIEGRQSWLGGMAQRLDYRLAARSVAA